MFQKKSDKKKNYGKMTRYSQRFLNYIKCQNDYIFTKISELYQVTKCFNTLKFYTQ